MSAEYLTERLMDALPAGVDLEDSEPTEDVLSGGFFFEVTCKGRTYEVLVTEMRRA